MTFNQKPEKSLLTIVLAFLFQCLGYYFINKINRPTKTTTIIVIILGLIVATLGLFETDYLSAIMYGCLGFALIAWVLYRNKYPQAIKPSPIQQFEQLIAAFKNRGEAIKNTREQGIPLQAWMEKTYGVKNTARESRTPAGVVGLLAGLVICGVAVIIGFSLIHAEWRLNHEFIETSCTITNKTLIAKEAIDKNNKRLVYFQEKFEVHYQINNHPVSEWIAVTPTSTPTTSYAAHKTILDRFNQAQIYPCWYDPKSPKIVALQRSYSGLPYLIFGSSFIVFIILLWALINLMLKKTFQ